MATKVHVAISATNRTGDAVAGGDGAVYSATFSTFTAAFNNATYGVRDLIAADEIAIYEMFLDVSPLEDSFNVNGFITSPSTYVTIKAEADSKHDGTPNNGAEIIGSTAADTVTLNSRYTEFEDLIVGNTYWNKKSAILCSGANLKVKRSFFTIGSVGLSCIFFRGAQDCIIESCVSYASTKFGIKFEYSGSKNNTLSNCVFATTGAAISSFASGVNRFKNCVCIGGFDSGAIASDSSNNATDQADDAGLNPAGGGIVSITPEDEFADYLNYDFHLGAETQFIGSGADLSAESIRDIDGVLFQVPFPIGIDESVQLTVPVELNNIPLGTEIRIFDNDSNAELVGVESSAASPVVLDMPYPGVPVNTRIVLLNMNYRYQVLTAEIGPNGLSFPVTLAMDRVYKNP